MTASIKDVAALAGVSIATVSRTLNTPDRVSPATRDTVRQAVATLGFRLSRIGQQLRGDRSRLIGVMLPSIASPVFAECVEGIEAAATAAGYQILLMSTAYDGVREQAALDTLLRQRVDGLILTVAHAHEHPLLDELERTGAPYVLVYNQCPHRPCVSVDNRGAARDGVAALITAGYRRIVMLSGAMAASDRAWQRYLGYGDALAAAGLVATPALEVDFNSVTLPAVVLAALTDPETRPDALFCGNDRLAMLVMRQLQQAGLALPRDIAILGFDGLDVGTLMSPVLASVCQPNARLGAMAMQSLDLAIRDDAAPVSRILPHSLRLGGSAAPVRFRPD
ncbi:LacI family DNA-binding transcriptional regulator [Paludibacterium yongneupense]|uniref:LacI family DNA-binding transcriptional regulator n=1 Tax=Paludibacterium yongneupense TaxID=400061 RepID=UPI000427BAE6|nr:LacI family DNA-binding transcriptional regulator [Paludibacterium yongneupense]